MITIVEVVSKKELKAIIKFELSTLLRDQNPAFDHCDAKYWMAMKDGQIVGRIAGIIHSKEFSKEKKVRFGWIDFIDDKEVSKKLIETVANWGRSKGGSNIHGPVGFTDFDFEGSLISGFNEMATQATIYNYPYYHEHYEHLKFGKAVDWVEVRGWLPDQMPKRLERSASIIQSRFGIKVKKIQNNKEIKKYAPTMFKILNKSYSELYGYHPLTSKQIDYYVEQYLGFVRKEFLSLVVDKKGEGIAIAISLPSLSKAFQKAKGSLYPFGFIHILKDFYKNDHLDCLLIGVNPEYQKLGASTVLFHDLFKTYIEKGVKYLSTGPMLEENNAVLNLWNEFSDYIDDVGIKRRCYFKPL